MTQSERCCLHDCPAIDCPEDVCELDRVKQSPYVARARSNEEEARRLYDMGWTMASIAARLGVQQRTVYNYLQQPVPR